VKAWDLTEGDDQYEYDYLEGWEKGKHRKYCREMGKKAFHNFVERTMLYAEDVETMGSITHFGWLPAISFNSYEENAILNAYVTPLPERKGKPLNGKPIDDDDDRHWRNIKQAILNLYSKRYSYASQTYRNYMNKV